MKINKDQFFPSRLKKLKFNYNRGSGHFFAYLLNRLKWHYYPRLRYAGKFPDHLDLETSSVCNMKCPMCYTNTDEFKFRVDREFMDFELFKKIIDEAVIYGAYSIRISLRGEPFLHKQVVEMIRYAKEKGIKEVSSLTNNLALNPDLFREVMLAGLDWLTISFDGLGKTYEWIRQPAKFEESYSKIKQYYNLKKNSHSLKPLIKVQTVWPAIKDCSKEYFAAFNHYVDDIAINPLIDYLHKDENVQYLDKFVCPVLFQRIAVGSDGIVLLCSNDEFGFYPIGDANKESIYDIWNGQKIKEARQIHRRYKGIELLQPCKHCYLPRKTKPVVEHIGRKKIIIDKYINRPEVIGR